MEYFAVCKVKRFEQVDGDFNLKYQIKILNANEGNDPVNWKGGFYGREELV